MNTKPILFNGEMIRALLDGRKTQTRRVVKPQPDLSDFHTTSPSGRYFDASDATAQLVGNNEWFISIPGMAYGPMVCPYGKPWDLLIPSVIIEGYDEKYAAGIDGNIYSRARGEWRTLKTWRQPKGYHSVTLMTPAGKKQSKTVHRLVCGAFYGEPLDPSWQVRHLDGNPDNGLPNNLCWGTQRENWRDRKAHGNGVEGEKHHASKFSDMERSHIKWAVDNGLCSGREAAHVLGVAQNTIIGICGYESTNSGQTIPYNLIPPTTLKISDIRLERVQEISEGDAMREGDPKQGLVASENTHRDWFCALWDSINGKKEGRSWNGNPWAWVIEFEVIQKNVDTAVKE